MKSLFALSLSALISVSALSAETKSPARADLAKGQEKASQVCIACHVFDGTRGLPANPLLQGQHADYLVKQLTEFKAGKRINAIMAGMAGGLTEEDIKNVAAFYAGKKPVAGAAKDKNLAALGEKIYRGGIAAKQVPACAGCHSPNGAGIPAQFPRLGGQHAEYTELQLTTFRAGTRGNSAQMMAIAARLNDQEIKALSDYMAGLH
jgi:cytochrome c553